LIFAALAGLWAFYEMRGELQTARELGEQYLNLAQNLQDPPCLLSGHCILGDTLFWLGEFASARAHTEQGLAFYDPRAHRDLATRYGFIDPAMVSYGAAGLALWQLGYPDQALRSIRKALSLAEELAHPLTLASALSFAALLHQFRREGQLTQERTEATITLATDQGFPTYLALGTLFRGWSLAEQASLPGRQGQAQEGISQIRQGKTYWRDSGAGCRQASFLALLSEAYEKVEQPKEGLVVLAEAFDAVNKTDDRFYEAELYRLKGELTLQKFQVPGSEFQVQTSHKSQVQSRKSKKANPQSLIPNPQAEAEACFLKAIDIARQQQAKSWELRATLSLARLWQQQGKKAEAGQMLAEIYGWFTEGFDTVDLKEAKALLEELSH
jgi:predicted ATPase